MNRIVTRGKTNNNYNNEWIKKRRVVITGMGGVTGLGDGIEWNWKRLMEGKSGITRIDKFDVSNFPSKVGGIVKRGTKEGEFDSNKYIPKEIKGVISPYIEFALAASSQALKDANWFPQSEEEMESTGVAIGSGIGSLEEIAHSQQLLNTSLRKVSPYFIPKILINLAAGHVSIQHQLKGVNHSASTACATGAHSIGDAYRFILFGDAKVMVAGGTESSIDPLSVAGFCRAKALSTSFNDTPELASRPFDKDRDGFVIGEGSGIVVLEELEHALNRNAKIYCEVLGYGLSGDSYHITTPSPDGSGAYRSMKSALRHAGIDVNQVDYINAHATSTPTGDAIENLAIKRLFGEHAYKLSISSTKSSIGHLLGASGSIEAIYSILSIRDNVVPPTLNLENPGEGFDLDYVPLRAKNREINVALSNSFGFGGTNATLVFGRYSE
eukprot:TRINITY_DN6208_c0_g1_i2.p1 TRINITY_DN6208_c0_g1~~TRINITY_DN6208_c0_g1_i2.p1  ORF type:complete len:440 (-),score=108.83 TRINITY_DN6208_c0_g1_i2:120-1439(-)